MFVIDLKCPDKPIIESDGVVHTSKNRSWFTGEDMYNDERHIIGSSAFYTYGAAKSAQLGNIEKILKWKHFHINNNRALFIKRCLDMKNRLLKGIVCAL